MNKPYSSPYSEMLANLMKDDCLMESEQKIFEVLTTTKKPLSVRELVRIIFGQDAERSGRRKKLEQEILDGIESLQGRAVPILPCDRVKYFLGNDLEMVRKMISDLESQIDDLQYRAKTMWIYYGRQTEPFQKMKDESKQSS